MILPASQKPTTPTIDLNGPEGNAYYLMGIATNWGRQLKKDVKAILDEMKSSDYENLVTVFDREFGDYCLIYR